MSTEQKKFNEVVENLKLLKLFFEEELKKWEGEEEDRD